MSKTHLSGHSAAPQVPALSQTHSIKTQEAPYHQPQDTLSCSLCTYAEVCLIPQIAISVRTHRDRTQPLMQVLDWSFQHAVNIDDGANSHQDLVSGMVVNEEGTLLATCSIDGSVRVWDVLQEFSDQGQDAVAIEKTKVVSGGSDHTVRVWDAVSGTMVRLISDLFISRHELDLGVYTVAIRGSHIGCGSVMEGYEIYDLGTGELIFELDEPLSSKDHLRFETELYQQYSSRMEITETVVVTNSKMEGMLCVWSRLTGELMYRIRVCPPQGNAATNGYERTRMVTHNVHEANSKIRSTAASNTMSEQVQEETVHMFSVNKSGSLLMCTLCDGRVSLIEFGSGSEPATPLPWIIRPAKSKPLISLSDAVELHNPQSARCTLAWIWMRDSQNHCRLTLV
ncbi:hypothetical protein BGZ51_007756 [Haplosporangium sp. Z 767]|nr:hypothetical protein BGZ51_007756 [Haplosporangium sp. Z 767]KAF9184041.1 hypothetical protein BGZ50_003923 [Haplosporangium sp. Z 11]